jgi:hypothetical protein
VLDGFETATILAGDGTQCPHPEIESPPILRQKDAARVTALLDARGGLDFYVDRVGHVK